MYKRQIHGLKGEVGSWRREDGGSIAVVARLTTVDPAKVPALVVAGFIVQVAPASVVGTEHV